MNEPRANRTDDAPIPRLPPGGGIKLSRGSIFRIAMFAILLVGVLLLQKPCADGIGHFIGSFELDAGPEATPDAASLPIQNYIHITGDMSDEEIRERLGQAGVLEVPDGGSADAARTEKSGEEE